MELDDRERQLIPAVGGWRLPVPMPKVLLSALRLARQVCVSPREEVQVVEEEAGTKDVAVAARQPSLIAAEPGAAQGLRHRGAATLQAKGRAIRDVSNGP